MNAHGFGLHMLVIRDNQNRKKKKKQEEETEKVKKIKTTETWKQGFSETIQCKSN